MSLGGGGTQTTTERSSKTYAPWIQDAQQDVAGIGFNLADPFLYASPYARAGQTADQLKAYDLSRLSAKDVYESPTITTGAFNPNFNAAQGRASSVTGANITPLMNPYTGEVERHAVDNMRREYQNADAGLASKYAAGGSFGGSGEAIARGQAARGYAQNVGQMSAQMRAAAFDKASALASQNAQMEQQAEMANVGARNQMQLSQADYGLKTPQVESQLRDAQQRRELQAAQAILAGGNAQQAFAQGNIDSPWTALERYARLVPQVFNSNEFKQKEAPDNSPGMGQQLLGAGMSILGSKTAGGGSLIGSLLGFSDERMKTDITEVGIDPETGLMDYAYRYKDDPKTYPKVVGPMAQEVEEMYPGTTKEIGGKLVINYGLLSEQVRDAMEAREVRDEAEAENLEHEPIVKLPKKAKPDDKAKADDMKSKDKAA